MCMLNGEKFFTATDYFKPYPDPKDVFSGDVEKHSEYLLPLATLDLSHINPEWSGPIHFVTPIEPEEGLVGQRKEEFHTYLCRSNWLAYQVNDGRYEFLADWRFFNKEDCAQFYIDVRASYERGKSYLDKHGCMHSHYHSAHIDTSETVELAYGIGGNTEDSNWVYGTGFPIKVHGEWFRQDGRPSPHYSPLTEDGRIFEYIGSIYMYNYTIRNEESWACLTATLVLFYDPIEKIALTTLTTHNKTQTRSECSIMNERMTGIGRQHEFAKPVVYRK